MKNPFIPYEMSVKLKELGFNEKCFDVYSDVKSVGMFRNSPRDRTPKILWQQVFDFFRKEHNLISSIVISGIDDYQIYIHCLDRRNLMFFKEYKDGYFSKIINFFYSNKDNVYEEARLECLKKLIEIVENKKG